MGDQARHSQAHVSGGSCLVKIKGYPFKVLPQGFIQYNHSKVLSLFKL